LISAKLQGEGCGPQCPHPDKVLHCRSHMSQPLQ
jgi:hypothetical protein